MKRAHPPALLAAMFTKWERPADVFKTRLSAKILQQPKAKLAKLSRLMEIPRATAA